MLYGFYKFIYNIIKKEMAKNDKKRLAKFIKPDDISKEVYKYNENEFNIYRKNIGPLIIDIHGGAFVYGDKDINDPFCCFLANNGYVVSSLTYTIKGEALLEKQINDIFSYINYLVLNKDNLKLNLNKVILTGDSAGALLCLLFVIINNNEMMLKELNLKKININIDYLILNHSVCYIKDAANLANHKILAKYVAIPGICRMLYGKDYKNDYLYNNTYEAELYINKETKLPKILLISSKGDKDFFNLTIKLYNLLKEKNKDVTLYLETDYKAIHVFNIIEPYSNLGLKCNNYLLDFICEV